VHSNKATHSNIATRTARTQHTFYRAHSLEMRAPVWWSNVGLARRIKIEVKVQIQKRQEW